MLPMRPARRARPRRRGVVNKPAPGPAPRGSKSDRVGSGRVGSARIQSDPVVPQRPRPWNHALLRAGLILRLRSDVQQRHTSMGGPRHGRLALARSLARSLARRTRGDTTAAKAWLRCLRIALPRRSRRRPGHPRRPATRSRHALSYRHHRGELGARSLCPMEIRTSTVRHVRGNTCWATTRIKRATAGRHRETRRDVARRCPSGSTGQVPPFLPMERLHFRH